MSDSVIVIDNGGGTLKAGLSGDDHPSAVVPNALGLHEYVNLLDEETFTKYKEACSSGSFKARYPISNGNITNWEDMETIWAHVIQDVLHMRPEESSLLITEPIANPKPAREQMAEILFEKFNFTAISIATSPILPMYAAGRTTGILVDVGDGVTQIAPIWGGYPITEAMTRVDFGGRDITQLIAKAYVNRVGSSASTLPPEVFRLMKEKACHILPRSNIDLEKMPSQTTFELPNGDKIDIGEEAYKCPEVLFNPSFCGDSDDDTKEGLHQLTYKSIMKSCIDVRKDLFHNVVLSGGSTVFPGFAERIETELAALAPASVRVNVVAHPARKYFTWIGGSVLGSLSSFSSTLVTKQQWENGDGRSAIHN